MNSANAQRSIMFLKRFVSPLFLGLLAIRLYCILFIVHKASKNFFQKPADDFEVTDLDFDQEVFSPWKSPLLLNVSIIFMLTQVSSSFLKKWSGSPQGPVSIKMFEWTSNVSVSRLLQILAVSSFYMWTLYRADDWTWNPWLTSE